MRSWWITNNRGLKWTVAWSFHRCDCRWFRLSRYWEKSGSGLNLADSPHWMCCLMVHASYWMRSIEFSNLNRPEQTQNQLSFIWNWFRFVAARINDKLAAFNFFPGSSIVEADWNSARWSSLNDFTENIAEGDSTNETTRLCLGINKKSYLVLMLVPFSQIPKLA